MNGNTNILDLLSLFAPGLGTATAGQGYNVPPMNMPLNLGPTPRSMPQQMPPSSPAMMGGAGANSGLLQQIMPMLLSIFSKGAITGA
jgi:hypothetical protein